MTSKSSFGIPSEYPQKKYWWEDADYTYGNFEQGGNVIHDTTIITFRFPNAGSRPVEFTDWLYRSKMNDKGEIIQSDKNITAEMLQCYIDDVNLHN